MLLGACSSAPPELGFLVGGTVVIGLLPRGIGAIAALLPRGLYAAASITVTGTINSTSNNYFWIDFFANSSADGSNHGEGQRFERHGGR